MVIRELRDTDALQHEYVSSQAFAYRLTPKEELSIPGDFMLGSFLDDDKTLTAEIECEGFENWFCDKRLRCAGISGVASKPEYRRGGAVRQLFERLYEMAPEKGYDISVLYPFSTAFYRRLGYANAGYYCSATVPFSEISSVERSFSVELYDGSQAEPLYALYNAIARKYNLAFYRAGNRYFIEKPYESCAYTYIWKDAAGSYKGYVTYRVNRADSLVIVTEIGFLDKEALLGVLGYLRTYDGNFKTLHFEKLPVNSPVFSVVRDLNSVSRTLGNIGAVRILDLRAVLNAMVYPREYGSFSFCSEDTIARNTGIFDVEYMNGKAQLHRRESGNFDIALDAAALSETILCGIQGGFQALSFAEGVSIHKKNEDFLRAFPRKDTFFTDGF